jgi:hypothetical protein
MGVTTRRGIVYLHCEICSNHQMYPLRGKFEEAKVAYLRAKEDGWRLSKERGKFQAYCPECSLASFDSPLDWP